MGRGTGAGLNGEKGSFQGLRISPPPIPLPCSSLDYTNLEPKDRAELSLPSPGKSPSLPVSVMLTPPSPTWSPTSALIHRELKALYDVLVLTWPTDHSELKFTAGVGKLDIWELREFQASLS